MISKFYSETPYSAATGDALKVWGDENLIYDNPSDNPYLEDISDHIPPYTGADNQVLITTTNGNESLLNTLSKQHFYVEAGDYGTTPWTITRSGSDVARRTISLYDGGDTHPAKLDKSALAKFALYFDGASYWTIDRLSYFDDSPSPNDNVIECNNGSTNNIFNRIFTDEVERSVRLIRGSHNCTVQNSRLTNMTHNARISDMTTIEVVPYSWNGEYKLTGTKVINNEMVNVSDSFQLVSYWYESGIPVYGDGTIMDGNDCYITDALYCDDNANYTPTGDWAVCEGGIDIKFGSSDELNPVIITNNRGWGYRKSPTALLPDVSDHGAAFVSHFGVTHTLVENNIFFDSNVGMGIGDKNNMPLAMSLSYVRNNIIYDCGKVGQAQYGRPFGFSECGDMIAQNNVVIACRTAFMHNTDNRSGTIIQNNLALDCATDWYLFDNYPGSVVTYHPANDANGTYLEVTAASQGYVYDYTFTTDKFTNSPRQITLTNVLSSPQE